MHLGLFGSIGGPELLIILGVALLMFGGRLPEVARSLGKSVNQFKKGLKDVQDEVDHADTNPPAPRALPTTGTLATPPTKSPDKALAKTPEKAPPG